MFTALRLALTGAMLERKRVSTGEEAEVTLRQANELCHAFALANSVDEDYLRQLVRPLFCDRDKAHVWEVEQVIRLAMFGGD